MCALVALGPAVALAAGGQRGRVGLERAAARAMRPGGAGSGADVVDMTSAQPLFGLRSRTPRILASNTKLFTTAAVLGILGPTSSIATDVLGKGELDASGVWRGSVYLRGGGDPTFGSRRFAQSAYGSDASVEALASRLRAVGIRRVSGAVVGDESLFDARRGGPASGYATSIWIGGPLSALSYDRGLANSAGTAVQSNPPLFAADRLRAALAAAGIRVGRGAKTGETPPDAVELVEVRSPPLARLVQITDKDSDNLFAELLAKGLAADTQAGGPLRHPGDPLPSPPAPGGAAASTPAQPAQLPAPGTGTTARGAAAAMSYARTLAVRPHLVDGSGLSRSDRASPAQIAALLARVRQQPYYPAFWAALAIAGRDGTLADRLRSGPAAGRCRGKTGTLTGVSALSGYCRAADRHILVFSVLMNGVDAGAAEVSEDAVAEAVAGY